MEGDQPRAPFAGMPAETLANTSLALDLKAAWLVFRERTRAVIDEPERTAALLSQKLEMAARAWPLLADDLVELARFFADQLAPHETALVGLGELHGDDLLLVHKLLRDDARAQAAFEQAVLADVGSFVRRMSLDADEVAEVAQRVRIKLLADEERKLRRYSGRHSLRSWVCTVALRTAIDLRRGRRPAPLDDEPADVMATTNDPELALLRARHQADFAAALAEACAGLERGQRRILRLTYAEGFSFRELGRVFGVDETTARRRLLRARDELVGSVRALLATRLQTPLAELDSLFALLQDRLDVSLARLLASEPRAD